MNQSFLFIECFQLPFRGWGSNDGGDAICLQNLLH